jgi:glucose dehydrogenase
VALAAAIVDNDRMILWETRFEYSAGAIPITYRGKNGKQYVAIMAAGQRDRGQPGIDGVFFTLRAP